jgi:hypothetical protein
MPKNKPDKEYYLLFLLIFILVFAFGVAIGCYVCSGGATGSVTFTVEDSPGTTAPQGIDVTFNGETKATDNNGEVTFSGVGVGTYDGSDVTVENYDVKKVNGTNVNNAQFTISDGQTADVSVEVKGTFGGAGGPAKLLESIATDSTESFK